MSKLEAETLVAQIIRFITQQIEDRVLRSGSKLPSIRMMALARNVSRFTVVEAYDRLVAQGLIESRRGSGFYVKQMQTPLFIEANTVVHKTWAESVDDKQGIDVVWLLRNMFRQLPAQAMPGSGLLPTDWLDSDLLAQSLRIVAKQSCQAMLGYGTPQGFLPLRQQLQVRLSEFAIQANAEQIILTTGVTQAIDLIARYFLQPGDSVLVDDPGWFLMFARLSMQGVKVVGVPRRQDGPDLNFLEQSLVADKPKLYFINSVLHNPTGHSLSAANAFQLLRLAEKYNLILVEDDIYADLFPAHGAIIPPTRLASLDQLNRVIYLSSFSKTLAANLRVGYIAAHPDLVRTLTDYKMLTGITSSELAERVLYKILSTGHYRKHVERLRNRLDDARLVVLKELERLGLQLDFSPQAGMFAWVNCKCDTNALAANMLKANILLAPGSLFSLKREASQYMRLNVASLADKKLMLAFTQGLEKSS